MLADPRAVVLVCCTEVSSAHFHHTARLDQLIANTLFADGAPLATEKTDFEVVKTGFEARVAHAAMVQPWVYGVFTVMLAIGFGWLSNYAFRRD